MPNDPNAPSFDLDGAREISQRLGRREATPAKEPAPTPAEEGGPSYTRFSAARFMGQSGAAPSSPKAPAPEPETATARVSEAEVAQQAKKPWDSLVDWFLELTGGHTCFVMDPQGLTASARGRDADQGDAVGPRLMIALEQAALMRRDGQVASSVVFELGDDWITGISVKADDDSRITVGLASESPVAGPLREAISATIVAKLRADY